MKREKAEEKKKEMGSLGEEAGSLHLSLSPALCFGREEVETGRRQKILCLLHGHCILYL